MNLSIQNYIINKNTNYRKTAFKGKTLTSSAFVAEPEIIEKIKTLPKNVFEERTKFLKFCKSIDITPKISRAIKKRLAEVRQAKEPPNDAMKTFIESTKRVVEGYKWLLNNGRKLLKNEMAELAGISFDTRLPQDTRNTAKEVLEKNLNSLLF